MTLHIILTCLRHPLSWRKCVQEAVKHDPKVSEWRDQRFAAVEATKHELRTMPFEGDLFPTHRGATEQVDP